MTVLVMNRSRRRLTALRRPARDVPRADLTDVLERHPRPFVACVAVAAGLVAGLGAGPVAAALAGVYAAAGALLVLRQRHAAQGARADAATMDTVADMAAELRAGAPPSAVVTAAEAVLRATPVEQAAVVAAWHVSQRTGAPLADVLDRVEAQLRQAQRLGLTVAAHRAGVRATALLLALLPAGGVALGYGMGADPLTLLVGTPLGACCAGLACVLQFAGVWWTEWLSRVDVS